jgi:hypothetical protein
LSNKVSGIDYSGEFIEGEPSSKFFWKLMIKVFPNEFVVKVYTMAAVTDEEGNESIHRVDLNQAHDDINMIFDKNKISIEVFVVYQGPDYPDPNPPPVEEKKGAGKGKAKTSKGEPEEIEIPMLKPDPVFYFF